MMSPSNRFVLGTRGSPLALTQTNLVVERLYELDRSLDLVIRTVKTLGDRISDRPISALGDKAVFVQPLADLLSRGEIDMAVHSLKDVPGDTEMPGLELAAFALREDPRDVLVSRQGEQLHELPPGSVIGTGSARRRAQVINARPDLELRPLRGNVDTRLRKLEVGEYDAIILAAAGMNRLGLGERITQFLDPARFIPDPGQGIIAVQTRAAVDATELARNIDELAVRSAGEAERAVARGLNANCQSPVGALGLIEGDEIQVHGMAATSDLATIKWLRAQGPISRAAEIGLELGKHLYAQLPQ